MAAASGYLCGAIQFGDTLNAREIVAHIEGIKPENWRDRLWLLMMGAGVVLLICAALAV